MSRNNVDHTSPHNRAASRNRPSQRGRPQRTNRRNFDRRDLKSKANDTTLVLGIVSTLVLALGMCMCMVEQWYAFTRGIIAGIVGITLLLGLVPLVKGVK